jgi:hypothetical protein
VPIAKTINTDADIAVPYWVLASTLIDHLGAGSIRCIWNGYKDKAAFDAGKAPVVQEVVPIPFPGAGLPAAYLTYVVAQTKLTVKFNGATDTP